MHKIKLISTVFFASIKLSFAQSINFEQQNETKQKMIVFPSFAQLPEENQEIVRIEEIGTKQESILEVKKDNLNVKIEDEKLKMAGYLMKKGGDQIMTGGIVSAASIGIGFLLIIASGSNSLGSGSRNDPAIALAGSVIGLAGVISGSVLRISGGSNIKKAGKILSGEPVF